MNNLILNLIYIYADQNLADTACKKKHIRTFSDADDDDRSEEYERIYANLLPSDYTLLKAPFYVRDFIVGNASYLYLSINVVTENSCP